LITVLAQSVEDVVGEWKMITEFPPGQENESKVVFSMQDGVLKGVAEGRRGSRELLDVRYENGVLSWGIVIPRLSTEPFRTEVVIEGVGFTGSTKTPLGEIKVRGTKWTEEAQQQLAEAIKAILGEWDITSTFNNSQVESQLRIFLDDENDLRAEVVMPGTNLDIRRIQFDGETLRWSVMLPFVSGEPARAAVKIAENKFEGVLSSTLGEIPIRGELVDTTKLVLAPYDSPDAILGAWDVVANINGEENQAKVTFSIDGERIKGVIDGAEGQQFVAQQVEYKKVGESMGVVQMSVVIPDLGEQPQTFELIVDGDSFEGEEVHSNGALYFKGTRAST
jgi:hypothetical protein